MLKGEIHFYNKGDKVCPVKKYKFSDAFLVYFSETFYAFGTENMQTTLILSPAIQNYGVQLVKHWQVSWIPPSEPNYYVPKKEEEEENILKEEEECFCGRDFTEEEFRNIVIGLRKKEIYIKNGRLIKDSKGKPILKEGKKQFIDITIFDEIGENIFDLDYTEKIRKEDANFKTFTDAINKTLNDYEINTCIRKIHFLAQCYHETQRFTCTYEKSPNSNVKGGAFYRGRG